MNAQEKAAREAMDTLDSAIYTGDTFEANKALRKEFLALIAAWQAAMINLEYQAWKEEQGAK